MSILVSDLKLYGSATMPDSDTPTDIGGAIDRTKRVTFADVNGLVQIVSSAASGDTTQTVTVSGRNAAGAIIPEVKTLNNQTPVAVTQSFERLEKAVKSATTTGAVAVEAQTASRTGTCQAGAADGTTATLDAGASAVDEFYRGMILRVTAGTGAGQIRRIIKYVGSTKVATFDDLVGTPLDGTSVFRVAPGFFFDKTPVEVMEVRRLFYDASADVPGGATRKYYDKCFWENRHATITLTGAQAVEGADPSAVIAFGLAATLDDTGTNGVGNNRRVAPAGITFDSTAKNVATGDLAASKRQGIWFELTLPAGAAPLKSSFSPRLTGGTT